MAESPGYTGQVGQRLVGIALLVFRTRHRFEQGKLNFHYYQRRMRRLRKAFRLTLEKGKSVRGLFIIHVKRGHSLSKPYAVRLYKASSLKRGLF